MTLRSYPSIYNLGHKAIAGLFFDPVVVQEKIDGSQISFGVLDGALQIKSKGSPQHPDAPDKMFTAGCEAIKELVSVLTPGWTYRGEYLSKPKHNVLAYDRVPQRHIILFDIETNDDQDFLSPQAVANEAFRVGLEVVPTMFAGMVESFEDLLRFLDTESVLGGVKPEGLVFKNYHRYGIDKKALMGKYVTDVFKESHKKDWGEANPGRGDILLKFIQAFKTPARWQKAVIHLEEQGKLGHSPQDIGLLIKEIPADILTEEGDWIKGELFDYFWPQIRRGVTGGFPDWYKRLLASSQFGEAAVANAEMAVVDGEDTSWGV